MQWKSLLLHLFFPNRCPFCDKVIELERHCCEDCESSLVLLTEEESSPSAQWSGFCAAFAYDGLPKYALWSFKFQNNPYYGEQLSYYLAEQLKNRHWISCIDAIGFVPMTRKRQKQRGYNQAQLLAEGVSRFLKIPCEKLLEKILETEQQHTLSQNMRKYNLSGAYDAASGANIRGRNILLIDDVCTTGATLLQCAEVLRYYGAESIYAATFCQVLHQNSRQMETQSTAESTKKQIAVLNSGDSC